jgi:hypothetical protein
MLNVSVPRSCLFVVDGFVVVLLPSESWTVLASVPLFEIQMAGASIVPP